MHSKHKPHIDWFRDAAPYINAYRNKTVVIAISGEAIANATIEHFVHDIALLHFLGVKVVLVHGSRTQIQQSLESNKITSAFHKNIRITSSEILNHVIQAVMLNTTALTSLFSTGLPNTAMSGACITVSSGNYISAKPLGVLDGVDMQHTGKVRGVSTQAINQLLEQDHLVILSNIGYSKTGEVFNLSMVDVATQTAIRLNADKLIFMTDSDFHQSWSHFNSTIEVKQWLITQQLDEHETEIMHHAIEAIDENINRVHLINHHIDGGLLLELFTREGCGSLISNQNYQGLRQASSSDITGIYDLIQPLVSTGKLIARSKEQIEKEIKHFYIIEVDGFIGACAAYFPTPDAQAEFACVAVHNDHQNQGFASQLLSHIEQHAKQSKIEMIFSLSTQTEHWFLSKGFVRGDLTLIPSSKQASLDKKRHSKILYKKL
ncbi:MAG: amino-acid N-acetyltransferase [Gammaproteobacteria bacterium]|nr:amino-acid N-acetyltransferase [Gammaproteobacteria bacterium]